MATPVLAPMAGKVLRIEKKAGDPIAEDEVIVVLEAMKMEIPVVATATGTITEISVAPGQFVETETVLAVIE